MRRRAREAELKLDFVIVGGGIAGLATAYMLSESGHRVRVIEKRGLGEGGSGGLRVPPNLSKIFLQWFGHRKLAQATVRCNGIPFHDLETGNFIAYFPWSQCVMEEAGGDFLLMHHEDCHRMLYEIAVRSGVRVDLNTSIVSIREGSSPRSNPSITLANGEVITADVLIGADGPRSMTRKIVQGGKDGVVRSTGVTLYSATVPEAQISKDPELQRCFHQNEWSIFMGSHRSLSAHAVRPRQEYAFYIYTHDPVDSYPHDEKEPWGDIVAPVQLQLDCYPPQLQRLIKMAPSISRTPFLMPTSEPERWSDPLKRTLLVGEAAHPWLASGAFGTSMALEDAVVLGTLFSRLRVWAQVPAFMCAYEELRRPRCEQIRRTEIRHATLVAMPPGPVTRMRDECFRGYAQEDEEIVRAHLEEVAEIFCYEAAEAAEEWWVNWGRHIDPEPDGEFDFFDYEVTVIEGSDEE